MVYNDDTTVKILEMMGERVRAATLAEEADDDAAAGPDFAAEGSAEKPKAKRKGTFTSGIVAT